MPSNISEKQDHPFRGLTWMGTAITAMWIGSIAWGVNQVTGQIDRLTAQQERFSNQFTDYITRTEARLTTLEVQARADKEKK